MNDAEEEADKTGSNRLTALLNAYTRIGQVDRNVVL